MFVSDENRARIDLNVTLSNNEIEAINESVDVIEDEVKSAKPRKGFIKTALTGLKAIKGTAEFSAAVAALIQFVQTLL